MRFDFLLAIYIWTIDSPKLFKLVNEMMHHPLRDQGPGGISKSLRHCLPFIKYLDTALEHLPDKYHFAGQVNRGVKWAYPAPKPPTTEPPREGEHNPEGYFFPGREFYFYEFKSAATNFDTMYMESFCGTRGPRTIFTIQACQCYLVKPFSHFPEEAEVLFRPLARFCVAASRRSLKPEHLLEDPNSTAAPLGGIPDQINLVQVTDDDDDDDDFGEMEPETDDHEAMPPKFTALNFTPVRGEVVKQVLGPGSQWEELCARVHSSSDRDGETGRHLIIESITEITNDALNKRFLQRRKEMARVGAPAGGAGLGMSFEGAETVFKFHGTSSDSAETIYESGFAIPKNFNTDQEVLIVSPDHAPELATVQGRRSASMYRVKKRGSGDELTLPSSLLWYRADAPDPAGDDFEGYEEGHTAADPDGGESLLLLGGAVYFATESSKSGAYTENTLILCELAMGKVMRVTESHHNMDYYELHERQGYDSMFIPAGSMHEDSDSDDGEEHGLKYDEFAIYHPHQAIPRFEIKFRTPKVDSAIEVAERASKHGSGTPQMIVGSTVYKGKKKGKVTYINAGEHAGQDVSGFLDVDWGGGNIEEYIDPSQLSLPTFRTELQGGKLATVTGVLANPNSSADEVEEAAALLAQLCWEDQAGKQRLNSILSWDSVSRAIQNSASETTLWQLFRLVANYTYQARDFDKALEICTQASWALTLESEFLWQKAAFALCNISAGISLTDGPLPIALQDEIIERLSRTLSKAKTPMSRLCAIIALRNFMSRNIPGLPWAIIAQTMEESAWRLKDWLAAVLGLARNVLSKDAGLQRASSANRGHFPARLHDLYCGKLDPTNAWNHDKDTRDLVYLCLRYFETPEHEVQRMANATAQHLQDLQVLRLSGHELVSYVFYIPYALERIGGRPFCAEICRLASPSIEALCNQLNKDGPTATPSQMFVCGCFGDLVEKGGGRRYIRDSMYKTIVSWKPLRKQGEAKLGRRKQEKGYASEGAAA